MRFPIVAALIASSVPVTMAHAADYVQFDFQAIGDSLYIDYFTQVQTPYTVVTYFRFVETLDVFQGSSANTGYANQTFYMSSLNHVGSTISVSGLGFTQNVSFSFSLPTDSNLLALNDGPSTISNSTFVANPVGVQRGFGPTFGAIFTVQSSTFAADAAPVLGLSITSQLASPTPLPEPSSWTMLILGFGLVGAGMRRRSYAWQRVTS